MSEKTWQIISGVLAIVVIALLINGFGKTTATTQPTAQPSAKVDMTVLATDVVRGSADAKVTIIEYSDPSCPFCAAAAGADIDAGGTKIISGYLQKNSPSWQPPVPNIMKDYVDTGKVRFVFRYYPGHGLGEESMKVLLCANEQGKFWQLHDVVFNAQTELNSIANDKSDLNSKLESLASSVGVDTSKLEACLATNKYDAKLASDTALGQAAGVSGTPAFAINGQLVEGAQPYSSFKQAIDSILGA